MPDPKPTHQGDPHYVSLRARANDERSNMTRCLEESKQAYESGDEAGGKALSDESWEHKERMNELNGEAAIWIFEKNNADYGPRVTVHDFTVIDVDGLYVQEAIYCINWAVGNARYLRQETRIGIVLGRDAYCSDGVPGIIPAIKEFAGKYDLVLYSDSDTGPLVLQW